MSKERKQKKSEKYCAEQAAHRQSLSSGLPPFIHLYFLTLFHFLASISGQKLEWNSTFLSCFGFSSAFELFNSARNVQLLSLSLVSQIRG